MSSSKGSPVDHFTRRSGRKGSHKGNWSGLNIAAMVVGFILFWPVGLVLLYWNISGRDIRDLPEVIQKKWLAFFNKNNISESLGSENSVFNEFQQTQYDRIREIKEEIQSRARHFRHFRSKAKRRADEQEFKDFMANNPES